MLLAPSCETWDYSTGTSILQFQFRIVLGCFSYPIAMRRFDTNSKQCCLSPSHVRNITYLPPWIAFQNLGTPFCAKLVALKLEASVVRDSKEKWSRREMAMEQTQRIQESFKTHDGVFLSSWACIAPFLMSGHLCPIRCRWRWLFVEAGGHPIFPRHAVWFVFVFFWFFLSIPWSQVNLSSRRRRPA